MNDEHPIRGPVWESSAPESPAVKVESQTGDSFAFHMWNEIVNDSADCAEKEVSPQFPNPAPGSNGGIPNEAIRDKTVRRMRTLPAKRSPRQKQKEKVKDVKEKDRDLASLVGAYLEMELESAKGARARQRRLSALARPRIVTETENAKMKHAEHADADEGCNSATAVVSPDANNGIRNHPHGHANEKLRKTRESRVRTKPAWASASSASTEYKMKIVIAEEFEDATGERPFFRKVKTQAQVPKWESGNAKPKRVTGAAKSKPKMRAKTRHL